MFQIWSQSDFKRTQNATKRKIRVSGQQVNAWAWFLWRLRVGQGYQVSSSGNVWDTCRDDSARKSLNAWAWKELRSSALVLGHGDSSARALAEKKRKNNKYMSQYGNLSYHTSLRHKERNIERKRVRDQRDRVNLPELLLFNLFALSRLWIHQRVPDEVIFILLSSFSWLG